MGRSDAGRACHQHRRGGLCRYAQLFACAKAVDDVDAGKVLAELRRAPIKGTLFGDVTVRRDGRVVNDVGVYRVKRPGEIQQRWAYYDQLAMIQGAAAFPPAACQTQSGPVAQDGQRLAGAVP
jgi:hypothetical protein